MVFHKVPIENRITKIITQGQPLRAKSHIIFSIELLRIDLNKILPLKNYIIQKIINIFYAHQPEFTPEYFDDNYDIDYNIIKNQNLTLKFKKNH